MNPDGDNHGVLALIATAIVTGAGALWKIWFAVKRDVRDDKKGDVIHGTYEEIIVSLRAQLREERQLREAAEERAQMLHERLRVLTGGD